jgi:hypothetical protein
VLSGRGLCDELITHPEKSYRLRCVVVCDLETSRMRRPWPALGRSAIKKSLLGSQECTQFSNINWFIKKAWWWPCGVETCSQSNSN